MLIQGPNKQKTNLLFLRFDILPLSIYMYNIYIDNIQFPKNSNNHHFMIIV